VEINQRGTQATGKLDAKRSGGNHDAVTKDQTITDRTEEK
jgi:hypothetical protein